MCAKCVAEEAPPLALDDAMVGLLAAAGGVEGRLAQDEDAVRGGLDIA